MLNCRSCFSKKVKNLFKKNDFIIYRCLNCGLVSSDKVYSNSQICSFYSDKYYNNIKRFSSITDSRYSSILAYLSKYAKSNRILDIGCGTGQFLLAAGREGWNVSGVEISQDITQWAREKFGLDIICSEFLEIDFKRNYFDVVTMFESIEHLNFSKAYLKKINFILKDKGILFMTTPNFSSLSRRLLGKRWRVFSKEHLFYFSPPILKRLLKESGFRIIKCVTKNFSILEFKNLLIRQKDKEQSVSDAERLREQIEKSGLLKLLKKSINSCLNLLQLGDSICIFAQKVQEIK